MKRPLDIRFFVHSLVSDWNHGNAHFLRGLVRALGRMGHRVRSYEQLGSWSLSNLVNQEHERSIDAINQFRQTYPELDIHFYQDDSGLLPYLRQELKHADVVIIHEWNEPRIVNAILSVKDEIGFKALFHDTHHRAYTSPGEMLRFHLHRFDGVLAFGDAIRQIYQDGFGMRNVWIFHEAAAVDAFRPIRKPKVNDVVWIGNWGDEERTRELRNFLLEPVRSLGNIKSVVYGVRYPDSAQQELAAAGIEYRGYLPNLEAPSVYAESVVTVHVPRRQYTNGLSGIPTIRVFEALACGIPLVCAPWEDAESLFRPGEDYLVVHDTEQMRNELEHLMHDAAARQQIGQNGLATILRRHTCEHRAEQLTAICEEVIA
jgi:spore maturation protein CgeB